MQAAWGLSQWDHQGSSFLGTLEAAFRNQSRRRAHWQDNKILLGSRAITPPPPPPPCFWWRGGMHAFLSVCCIFPWPVLLLVLRGDLLRMLTSQELHGGCYPVTQSEKVQPPPCHSRIDPSIPSNLVLCPGKQHRAGDQGGHFSLDIMGLDLYGTIRHLPFQESIPMEMSGRRKLSWPF